MTDVDDRIIQKAQEAGTDLGAFTAEYVKAFEEDMATLRLERPEHMPRATEHIPEMLDLIGRLQARGHTYTADGSVYFRIASFPEYGRLARLDVAGIQAGARVDTDKYDKENARDFVLWKFKSDEPEWAQWEAPFGKGRPGWHIECSAMSMKYLGETFDLHAGGEDLIFPHHENEIAQSTCGTGKLFARHWMHVKHLLIDNETMSKSKGNFLTIPDLLEKGHSPQAIRYLLAGSHYRKPLNFGLEGLSGGQAPRSSGSTASSCGSTRWAGRGRRERRPRRPAPRRGGRSTRRSRTTSTRRRPWPRSTASSVARTPCWPRGRSPARGRPASGPSSRRWTPSSACCSPGAGRTASRRRSRLSSTSGRRRGGGGSSPARTPRGARLEALGVVLEDTPKGTRWRRKR